MAIVDALNKVTGGHGATIEEAVKNLGAGGPFVQIEGAATSYMYTTQAGVRVSYSELKEMFLAGKIPYFVSCTNVPENPDYDNYALYYLVSLSEAKKVTGTQKYTAGFFDGFTRTVLLNAATNDEDMKTEFWDWPE